MKVKSESEVAQSCLTLIDPKDCSLLGFSIHGIFQARILEWGAMLLLLLLSRCCLWGPPGSPVPGILQARTLEWIAISSSNA